MLIASDPLASAGKPSASRVVTHNPVARESRQKPPGIRHRRPVPSGGGSGCFGKPMLPSPSAWRFRDRPLTLPFRAFDPPRRSAASLLPFPAAPGQSASRAPLTASAVRQAHSGERTRRVFRRCCGHRCQIDGFAFSPSVSAVSRRNFKFGLTVSTSQSCACGPSRASKKCMTYPQRHRFAVDKSAD